jgi:prepilin signal peptidase PulO-like enzyme (type II secretory pathway)
MVFIFYIIGKKSKNKKSKGKKLNYTFTIIVICAIRFIFDDSLYTIEFWKEFLYIFIFLMTFRTITNIGAESFHKEVSIKNLKPGMLLAEKIIKKGKKYEKEKNQGLFNLKKGFIEEQAEGITAEDIKKINKTGIKKIKIKQTIPFAPFMFLGVLLTLIVKGNILILVNFLF